MNLAIDIGNTSTKLALFEGQELKEVVSDSTIQTVLASHKVRRAIISRTGADQSVEAHLQENRVPFLVLSSKLKLPVEIVYKTPHTLGADRLAGSVAAHHLFPHNNVLKIDFGTCITYDFITPEGQFMGGGISPGMTMRFKALNHYTAGLPLVKPGPDSPFDLAGTDTATSILSGVINGIKEEVDGIINEYNGRFGKLRVVATGGDLYYFGTLLKSEIFARPYLVLEGLNRILNFNH